MKELKTWFEVLDFFAGSPPIETHTYEQAVALAGKKGITFTREIWTECVMAVGHP